MMANILLFTVVCATIVHGRVFIYTNSSREDQVYSDKLADFGDYPGRDGIYASLAIAKPLNACTTIQPNPYRNFKIFVLVEESVDQKLCSFEKQAWNAQSAGYVAVIIYRFQKNVGAVTMEGEGPKIIAVSVTNEAGQALKKAGYEPGNTFRITVELQIPFQMYLIPFVIVISICFFFMILFSIGRYCRYRLRQQRTRLSPANLKKIPTKKFKKGDEYDVCAICIEEYEENEKIRILPCNHAYHTKCVDPWLTSGKKVCPVCKQSVESDKKRKKRKKKTHVRSYDQASTSSRNSATSADDETECEDHNERTPLLSDNSGSLPSSGAMNV